jgi:hypothetical protein
LRKRRLGNHRSILNRPQSLPTAHGFDEFYGIPPDISWDSATYVDTIPAPREILIQRGPQIVEATAGGPLRTVKPFTPEVPTDDRSGRQARTRWARRSRATDLGDAPRARPGVKGNQAPHLVFDAFESHTASPVWDHDSSKGEYEQSPISC